MSLNMEARKAERAASLEKRLERENVRRAALGLEALPTVEALEELEAPDVHLDQAASIVTDLAIIREVGTSATQTARYVE